MRPDIQSALEHVHALNMAVRNRAEMESEAVLKPYQFVQEAIRDTFPDNAEERRSDVTIGHCKEILKDTARERGLRDTARFKPLMEKSK